MHTHTHTKTDGKTKPGGVGDRWRKSKKMEGGGGGGGRAAVTLVSGCRAILLPFIIQPLAAFT